MKICWVQIKDIEAKDFTKVLSAIKHKHFVEMIGIKDKRELLTFIK